MHLQDTFTKTTDALIFRWPAAKCSKVTQNKLERNTKCEVQNTEINTRVRGITRTGEAGSQNYNYAGQATININLLALRKFICAI